MSMTHHPAVLLISHGFPPASIAGTEQHVRALVNALRERFDFRVLTRDARGRSEEREEVVVRLPLGPKAGSVDELVDPHDAAFEAAALRLAGEFDPGLVHVHHWLHMSNSLAEVFAAQGLPVVVTLHDYYPICARVDLLRYGRVLCPGPEGGRACADCLPAPGAAFAGETLTHRAWRVIRSRIGAGGAARRWVLARAEQVFRARLEHMRGELERAQMVICPSVALKREITCVWPELEARLSVILHGVETAWGALVRWRASQRVRFTYLGTLTPHKGIEVLLAAFSMVGRRRAELTLWGAWASQDPEFRRRVEAAAAASGARLRGPYERADLAAILGETDVVVLPSTCKETASLVLREAFVGGAPVIASEVGALPEAVEIGRNGLLVRPGDAADLADKMNEIANNPGLLAHLRANVRPPKSIAEYAAEISEIYERLAGRRAADAPPCQGEVGPD